MTGNQTAQTGTAAARIVLVDDHPIVREGYQQLISQQPDLEVCGMAGDSQDALREVERTQPDLVLVDISLKSGNGLELCKQIRVRFPETKVLVASMHEESLFAERVLRAGAMGYINKDETTGKLIEAIRRVLSGKIYLSDAMKDRMLCRAVGSEHYNQESPIDTLSDRELEVFEFIGRGVTIRSIAERLNLSPKTVESYRENLKAKLNVENSAELTRHAVQWVLENKWTTQQDGAEA
jgi:DNA-binding NarL/FixJ family response regulator